MAVRRALHSFVQLTRGIIAVPGMDGGQVKTDVHSPAMDVAQVSVLDAPSEVTLEDDVLKHCIQAYLVAPVRRGSEPYELFRVEVAEDIPIGPGRCVVGLVADDQTELVRCEFVQSADKTLHAGGNHFLAVAAAGCPLNAVGTVEVFSGLLHQLLPVGENQHPLSMPRNIGEGYCLPHPSGHLHQVRSGLLTLYGVDALLLIRSKIHVSSCIASICPHSGGRLRTFVHSVFHSPPDNLDDVLGPCLIWPVTPPTVCADRSEVNPRQSSELSG